MNKRVAYIDYMKAFAIILVVLGHYALLYTNKTTDFFGIIMYIVYSFHMPLFFLLSGWSWKKSWKFQGLKKDIKNNFIWI